MTTTSWISPADVAEVVGLVATACECLAVGVYAEMHDHPDGCVRVAKWMVHLRHVTAIGPGCRPLVAALCPECLEEARRWAETSLGHSPERCPHCGARVRLVTDLITSVVAL